MCISTYIYIYTHIYTHLSLSLSLHIYIYIHIGGDGYQHGPTEKLGAKDYTPELTKVKLCWKVSVVDWTFPVKSTGNVTICWKVPLNIHWETPCPFGTRINICLTNASPQARHTETDPRHGTPTMARFHILLCYIQVVVCVPS